MKFRLVLRSITLRPEQQGTLAEKWQVRRELHPQLRTLWMQHSQLRDAWTVAQDGKCAIDRIADDFALHGYRFIPLLRKELRMVCALDLLVLLRDEPYGVFNNRGDLDNRIKTLIDGLTMPPAQRTAMDGTAPSGNEDPFYCLLEDDCLIHQYAVKTDRLLLPTDGSEPHKNVVAVIAVDVRYHDEPMAGTVLMTNGFLGSAARA